jgi:hypothetical protein
MGRIGRARRNARGLRHADPYHNRTRLPLELEKGATRHASSTRCCHPLASQPQPARQRNTR